MQRLSISELDAKFAGMLKGFRDEKRALFAELTPRLEAEVRAVIGGTGRIAGWQEGWTGSHGGYSAVRAMKDVWDVTRGGKRYAAGYITNAVTSGHKQKPGQFVPGLMVENRWGEFAPSGGQLKQKEVEGKHYYEQAARRSEALVRAAVAELAERLTRRVEE